MLKKSRVKLLKQEIIPFPTTAMKRNLLVVHVSESGCTKQLYFCLPNKKSQERLNWLFLYDRLKEQKTFSYKHINPVVFETDKSFMNVTYHPLFSSVITSENKTKSLLYFSQPLFFQCKTNINQSSVIQSFALWLDFVLELINMMWLRTLPLCFTCRWAYLVLNFASWLLIWRALEITPRNG